MNKYKRYILVDLETDAPATMTHQDDMETELVGSTLPDLINKIRVPLNRQIPKLDHTLASVMHGMGMADILFGKN